MDKGPEENKKNYTAQDIRVLKGLEGVRMRPAMYIGDVGKRGLHHLIYEIVDNSVDEALAGYCTEISITLNEDGSVTIEDNGRGIPVDVHPEKGIPAVQVVFTILHAGGKFGSKAYQISGGLHGVGASVVNALSEWLVVEVMRDGKIYRQKYSRGEVLTPLEVVGETDRTGTRVTFKPDPEIFKVTEFDYEILRDRIREIALLIGGLRFKLEDKRSGLKDEFYFEGGLAEFVNFLDEAKQRIAGPFYMKTKRDNVEIEIALSYNAGYVETILSFVNTINTHEGGTHLVGFKSGLTRAINDIAKRYNLVKENFSFHGDDVREGLTAVIHVKLPHPQFEGQTKTKLGNGYVKGLVESAFYEYFMRWMEENPKEAEKIVEKAKTAAKSREAAKRARELIRRKSFIESDSLPGKLSDCTSQTPEEAEIFIVEGESAGGSAKQGRDRYFQAVLPLKGKILNVEKAALHKALANEEIKVLLSAIDAGLKDDCDPSKARYHKIIIMTDADVDGAHIRTLLLTFFYRFMKPLVEAGYIYIAQPPLYRVQKGKKVYYVYSDEELDEKLKELGDGVHIQRYKGLGEMNPEQLWETTMNPENRVLKRVTVEDAAEADRLFSILMGDKVEPRREFIERNARKVQNLDV